MEKRFQVFISSTFEDLKIERQNVLKAILELDNMPAGMELFPAIDSDSWELIKDVINGSDYYVLVIGGRYGSLDSTGISYTEKEYDYAVKTGKPVIALLHKNPDNLPRDKTEVDPKTWGKLSAFRKKVEINHTCVYWNNSDELKSLLIIGLTKTIKRHPTVGWVRANLLPTEDTLKELLELRKINQELENKIKSESFSAPEGVEYLYQGKDILVIKCNFKANLPDKNTFSGHKTVSYTGKFNTTWNDIWGAISPIMINEPTAKEIKLSLKSFLSKQAKIIWEGKDDLKDGKIIDFGFESDLYDTVFVQFRALGLMKESVKQRSVKDSNTYWKFTSYGDNLMMQLRALRKDSNKRKATGQKKIESR